MPDINQDFRGHSRGQNLTLRMLEGTLSADGVLTNLEPAAADRPPAGAIVLGARTIVEVPLSGGGVAGIDLSLIRHVAKKGKPMIISTGMSNLAEIDEAVRTARENGCEELILLHCVSSYPAPDDQSNIRTVPHLGEAFDCVPGLSDHTHGSAVSVASVALGGCVIEKHFTLARADGGPDAEFSLEPDEFRQLVSDCKRAWVSLGKVGYDLKGAERGSIQFRRSLYVVSDVAGGEALTKANVRSIRPGFGLLPKHIDQVLGSKARRPLKRGEPLRWDMFET